MNFRKFRKSSKALSPVIATIILIAVTVAVSVVVAAWMGALTIGFMGNSEQASITGVQLFNYNDQGAPTFVGTYTAAANVTVQNTGSATVTINTASVDGNAWTVYTSSGQAGQVSIAKGTSVTFTIASDAATSFVNTAQYTISLHTAKGNTLTSQASYNGPVATSTP